MKTKKAPKCKAARHRFSGLSFWSSGGSTKSVQTCEHCSCRKVSDNWDHLQNRIRKVGQNEVYFETDE